MVKAAGITEKVFMAQIKSLAQTLGYKFYHTWHSIRSAKGYPDCTLCKPGRLIFCELKSESGTLTESQIEWLQALAQAGAETYVWRPSQFAEAVKILQHKPLEQVIVWRPSEIGVAVDILRHKPEEVNQDG
jgi:hypothetical protein